MIEPIVILLVLAAAPFAWVALDMWRRESERKHAAAVPAQTLVIEHVEPDDVPALAA